MVSCNVSGDDKKDNTGNNSGDSSWDDYDDSSGNNQGDESNSNTAPYLEGISKRVYSGSIGIGEAKILDSFEYSIRNFDNEQLSADNSAYIYEFIATSDFTIVTILDNNSLDFEPGYKVDSIDIIPFKSNGSKVSRSENNKKGETVFQSVIGDKYYICIKPIETVYNNVTYKSDKIKFVLHEYNDLNTSVEKAESVSVETNYSNFFSGGYDKDYYLVNLVAGNNYVFDLRASQANITITSPSGADIEIYEFNSAYIDDRFTAPETGEYTITIIQDTLNYFPLDSYWFSIINFDAIETINPSSAWTEGAIKTLESKYYKVNIDSSKEYTVSWKDRGNDISGYSADVSTSFYGDVSFNECVQMFHVYNSWGDVNETEYIDFYPEVTYAIIRFQSRSPFDTGSYSFKIEEDLTPRVYTAVSVGDFIDSYNSNGHTRFYKFTIDQSKKYMFNLKYQGNTSYSEGYGYANLSLYTPDKSEYFFRNTYLFDQNIAFQDTSSANTELILKVRHDFIDRKVGFQLIEDTAP